MDEHELARRVSALPGTFAGRLEPLDLETVHGYAEAGEWGEAVDLLVACLLHGRQPVTPAECAELTALLHAMGLPGRACPPRHS